MEEDEGLITSDENTCGDTGAVTMLPALGILMFEGDFDVQEDDGGLGMVVHVPEPDAGDGTLSYISAFVHLHCCLDTQLVHIGIQQ